MKYRLGLDMGTDSIGWAVIELSNDKKPSGIVDMGVRIFDGGRDPKTYESLAVERRIARGMRRMRDRRISRKKAIMYSLIEEKLMPSDETARKSLKTLNPYTLRHDALDRKLSEYELGRALYHMGSRRGFRSNRIEEKNSESRKQASMISNLTASMVAVNARTIGEFLWMRICNGQEARFKGSYDCYPSREHYETEFEAIKSKQSQYHDIDWNKIHNAIFYQRPLKVQEKGRCRYFTDEYRAYAALPSSHRYRILLDINNLVYSTLDGNSFTLSYAEKDILALALDDCVTMSFGSVRKLLKLDSSTKFNIENEKRSALKGNETSAKMRKADYFGKIWDTIPIEIQDKIVETLIVSETDEEASAVLNGYGLSDTCKKNILEFVFPKNMTMLSSKFMRQCSEIMASQHIGYSEAVKSMGLDHSAKNNEKSDFLPYYGEILTGQVTGSHPEATDKDDQYRYGKISNPTVHIALGQLRRVVNSLIERYGHPAQIVVELSRDIADGPEKKSEIRYLQAKNQKENERIEKQIKEITGFPRVSSQDIKKYKLWEELGKDALDRRCPYCGEIISGSQLFSKAIEIEHILPYSRTLLDSMNNLTVAHVSCNDFKSNQTPYEAFSSSPGKYNWESIVQRSRNLPNGKGLKFLANAMKKYENESGFLNSQLNDGRYIAKATREYLGCVCNDIWCVNGRNTAHLRSQWGLNHLLNRDSGNNSKNRNDHRHHSIDALVISLTDRSLVKAMADMNVRTAGNMERFKVPAFPFELNDVEEIIRNMLVSHRQDHGHTGKMFKETATGMKMVTKTIRLKDVSESIYRENRIKDQETVSDMAALIKEGKSFTAAKNSLLKKLGNKTIEISEPVWTTTKRITDLTDKDITEDRIFNINVREFIRNRTNDVIKDDKDLKKRLQELSENLNGLKKVKYIPNSQAFTPIKSVNNKWYERDSVNFVTIWEIPRKDKEPTYQGQFISYQEAYEYASGKLKEYPKPHPAAKKVGTIYKNDVLYIQPKEEQKKGYYALVAGYSATQNKIDIRPLNAVNTIPSWFDSVSLDSVSNIAEWGKCSGSQNFKSINAIYTDNKVKTVKITPDGKIQC